jgi:urease subunit alpha
MASELSRHEYAARYGPTTGDRVRLGDTNLLALIERDETSYGDEVLRGWGKTMRTGLMMQDRLPAASELDLLIANVIVIDPVLGIVKANIGMKDGLVVYPNSAVNSIAPKTGYNAPISRHVGGGNTMVSHLFY